MTLANKNELDNARNSGPRQTIFFAGGNPCGH